MTAKLKCVPVLAMVAASIVLPLSVQHHVHIKLREKDEALRRGAGQVEQSAAENERLSNSVAQANAQSLAGDQLLELLKLRSEVSQLRAQAASLQKLSEENQRLQIQSARPQQPGISMSAAERNDQLAIETVQAMKNIVAALPAALQKFAQDHHGQHPIDFSQLRNYFPASEGRRMPGLYTFEFIRAEGPQPGDALILREAGVRRRPDETSWRVYAFSDGRIGEQTLNENDFDAWEKQHLVSSPSNQ